MTSHYLHCKIASPFDQLFQYLSKYFGNVHNEQLGTTTEGRTAVFLGESYFIRTNSNAALLLILKEEGVSGSSLEVVSCAGASGTLEISWGVHSAYVHRVVDILKRAGLQVEVVKEVPNYTSV